MTIEIQNPILSLDCQSQSNPPKWVTILIEQSSKTLGITYEYQLMRNYHGLNNMIRKQLILFLNICAPCILAPLASASLAMAWLRRGPKKTQGYY